MRRLILLMGSMTLLANAQFSDSIDNYTEPSTTGPKIGLPLGTWSILDLDETQRTEICTSQIEFCKNDCGATSLNFCDPKTMHWGCNCQTQLPKTLPFQWPVTVAECTGKEKACESGCNTCGDMCQSYFKCNRPGSEPSQLRMNAQIASASHLSHPGWLLLLFTTLCHNKWFAL